MNKAKGKNNCVQVSQTNIHFSYFFVFFSLPRLTYINIQFSPDTKVLLLHLRFFFPLFFFFSISLSTFEILSSSKLYSLDHS